MSTFDPYPGKCPICGRKPQRNKKITIPIEQIDYGITNCVINALKILEVCQTVFEKRQQYGEFSIIEHSSDFSVVLYYYALEELGKAIKLEHEKIVAELQNKSEIKIDWWKNHDEKVDATIEKYGSEFHIIEAEPLPSGGRFHKIEYKNPAIGNFIDRSNLLLTDYNPQSKKWGRDLEHGTQYNLELKIPKLKKELETWQKRYPLR